MTASELPAHLSRPRRGRWIGGVCAGLAARTGVPARRVRGLFALATPVLGFGLVAYGVLWLLVPAEGEAGGAPGPRAAVSIAKACGALLALGALAVAAAAATVFGYGWVVVALGAALLVGVVVSWPRQGPAWALLPVGAVVLPSVALAAGGVRIEPSTQDVVVAPRTLADLPGRGLRSGLGLLTVDLRHTALPARGTVGLRIAAGVRRTLVALPHDRCVRVVVQRRALPFAVRAGSGLLGGGDAPGTALVFGRDGDRAPAGRPGPTLRLDFSSMGGELVVRDYPDAIDPRLQPDWPGYETPLERGHRADKPAARRAWRRRRAKQVAFNRRIRALRAGPCAKAPR